MWLSLWWIFLLWNNSIWLVILTFCTLDVLSWDTAAYKIESMINFEEEGLVSLLFLVNVFGPISPLIVFPNVIIWCLIYLMYYPKCHNLVRKIYDLKSYVFRSFVIWRWKTSFSHGPLDHFWAKKKIKWILSFSVEMLIWRSPKSFHFYMFAIKSIYDLCLLGTYTLNPCNAFSSRKYNTSTLHLCNISHWKSCILF